MPRTQRALSLPFLFGLIFSWPSQAASPSFDTVIHSLGQVVTTSETRGDAVALRNGKIVEIGPTADLLKGCVTPCVSISGKGGTLLPGLHDAHAHPISGAAAVDRVAVSGSSIPSIQAAVRAFAAAHPLTPWIFGRGWNAAGFGSRLPTAADLDAAEAKRPVVLRDSDGHQLWVNSAALAAAKITRETPDPKGGTIVRDSEGEPSGMLLENAADLLWEAAPELTEEQLRRYILLGEKNGLDAGFTAHHGGGVDLATMKAYAALDREGRLRQRAFLWGILELEDKDFEEVVAFDRSLPNDGLVRVSAFKGFVDGVISAHTAAMVEPYSDQPEVRGEPGYTPDELAKLVLRANSAGYPVALHAIGDGAVRMALDAFEASREVLGELTPMNRIEHIEVVHPLDVPRFAKLGVAASMQPSHMHFGSEASSYYPDALGDERLHHAFAWGKLLHEGATILFGTDYPVVPQDSIEGITCAIVRTYRDGTPFESQNRLEADAAIAAFTSAPSRAVGRAAGLGRIEPGYDADLVLFARDPRKADASNLSGNPPLRIWVRGRAYQPGH